jgi:predicted transcriptional regulator
LSDLVIGVCIQVKERAHSIDDTRDASKNRQIIFEHIRNNPGIYLRKISKDLGLAVGDTQHHISALQRKGLIRSLKYGLYRHYYSIDIGDTQHQAMLALLMQDTSRDILIHLVEHPGSGQSDIAKFKQMSSPTINWHMSRMISLSVIVGIRDGKFVRYFIRDIGSLIYVLTNYHPDIWRNLAPKLVEMFVRTASTRGMPN